MLKKISKKLRERRVINRYRDLYRKYREFTMIPEKYYVANLMVAQMSADLQGEIVECGVWRGGMIAGISELLGKKRTYHLFDSFEGLPEAKELDGEAAKQWQNNPDGKDFYNNATAEIEFAQKAISLSGANDVQFHKGWFSDTVPHNNIKEISLLRLDGDWYESTLECLTHLYPKVIYKGIIIIDDYYAWEGSSKAVHDYLSSLKSLSRIHKHNGVAYIIKLDQ